MRYSCGWRLYLIFALCKSAVLQAVSCIVGIILAGRTMLRPLYRRIADLDNAAIFSATTLLVVLGTSVVTQFAGLSLALGAFLVGTAKDLHLLTCMTQATSSHTVNLV